jgi:hypothetical protein
MTPRKTPSGEPEGAPSVEQQPEGAQSVEQQPEGAHSAEQQQRQEDEQRLEQQRQEERHDEDQRQAEQREQERVGGEEGEPGANLVEPEGVAEQREADLEAAQETTLDVDLSVDHRDQAYLSSHAARSPRDVGHPGHWPDNYTDGEVKYGTFCTVGGEGPYAGLYGVYIDNVSSDDSGMPEVVLVRERNSGRVVSVKYDELLPATAGDIGRGR